MTIADKLTDLRADLSECRRAITYRGGEISATAGFKEVAEKIASLPASSSVGTLIDEEVSLLKLVPSNSTKYCYLKSLGGMTYKSNNLIPYPYAETTKTVNGITFTDNGDGTITVNGTATGAAVFALVRDVNFTLPKDTYTLSGGLSQEVYTYVAFSNDGTWAGEIANYGSGTTKNTSSITYTHVTATIYVATGTVCNNLVVKPMLNRGTTALPYELYYAGLKDTKPTALKVHGANLIPFPYYSKSNTTNGITATVNEDGSITFNGTATDKVNFILGASIPLSPNESYIFSADNFVDGLSASAAVKYDANLASVYTNITPTTPAKVISKGYKVSDLRITIQSGTVCNNLVFKPILNIGSMALPYAPYHEPVTYAIPEELQGTGKGIEGASDLIDFERDKAIVKTKTIKLGDVKEYSIRKWGTGANVNILDNGCVGLYSYKFTDFDSSLRLKALCSHLDVTTSWNGNIPGVCLQYMENGSYIAVTVPIEYSGVVESDNYETILNKTIAWLRDNNVTLTYAIAEPTETDIDTSVFDPLIEVEPGGSIEFITDSGKAPNSTVIYQTIV